jgi:hypothetical protein
LVRFAEKRGYPFLVVHAGSKYANMDIFIFPAETDAFGNVAQETMAAGRPFSVIGAGRNL